MVKALGTVGIIGVLIWFPLIPFFVHFVQPELNPIARFISDYANGRLGWLIKLGFLAGGVGTVAIAVGMQRSLAPGKRVGASVVLMTLVGLVAMNGLYFVGVAGLLQRILVAFVVAWLVAIGLRLRALGA